MAKPGSRGVVQVASVRVILADGDITIDAHFRATEETIIVYHNIGVAERDLVEALRVVRDVLLDALPVEDGGPKPRRRIQFGGDQ